MRKSLINQKEYGKLHQIYAFFIVYENEYKGEQGENRFILAVAPNLISVINRH